MFKMRSRLTVTCDDRPFIWHHPNRFITHCYHRFYRYTHALFECNAIPASTVIGHLRIFMHFFTNAMTDKFSYHTVTIILAMHLNSISNVTKVTTTDSCLYTLIKRFLRYLQQFLHVLRNLADTKSVTRISVETVKKCSAVNTDDVTILQDTLLTRYSMNDLLVDRSANASGERPSVWIRETLKCRNSSIISNKLIRDFIQLKGRYTRFNMLC